MKKIVLIAFAGLLGFMMLATTSCDKVEAPYMEQGGSAVTSDTVRKILMEDFTGHMCVNCPAAHVMIKTVQAVYPHRIIPIAIHAGFFAKPKPAPYDYDFRTADGDAIATEFGAFAAALPKGMVNRKKHGGSYLLNPAGFAAAVSAELDNQPVLPDIYIELTPSYKSSDNTISVDVKMTVLKDFAAGKFKLSVLVVEDSIIQAQKNTNPDINNGAEILDYKHMDVLRGAINTTWGEEIASSALVKGQVINKSYSNYKIGADWKPEKLKLIAIVYYGDGVKEKEVIQVEEGHLN